MLNQNATSIQQAVESCLLSLPMVKACVVLVCGEEGEDKYMVAYIANERETTKKEVRAELKKRLPFFMIPSYFIFLQRYLISNRLFTTDFLNQTTAKTTRDFNKADTNCRHYLAYFTVSCQTHTSVLK